MTRAITSRMDVNVGKKCNFRCGFCYYGQQREGGNTSYQEIADYLGKLRKNGIDKIHITGGEPTLHREIHRIIKTARQLGFKDISVITNGYVLRDRAAAEEFKRSGADEFVISLHGAEAGTHDGFTGVAGSFEAALSGIANLKKEKIPFSVNIVMNKLNYRGLPAFARLLTGLRPKKVAILYFNPLDDSAAVLEAYGVEYEKTAPYLKTALDLLARNSIAACFKFVPPCLAGGYEKYLANESQALYDDEEWNYAKRLALARGKPVYWLSILKNFSCFRAAQLGRNSFSTLCYLSVLKDAHRRNFVKMPGCVNCRYFLVCDGISRLYLRRFGAGSLKPVEGWPVLHPSYFRSGDEGGRGITRRDKFLNSVLWLFSGLAGLCLPAGLKELELVDAAGGSKP